MSIKKDKLKLQICVEKALGKATNEDADERSESTIRVRVRRTCWDDSEAGYSDYSYVVFYLRYFL